MNSPADFPATKSPTRNVQLQGPRPTPLKVRKDSHKIRKPPVAPPPHQPPSQALAPPPPPVIIYTVSPKVIHTNPSDFMTLVQRLTGSGAGAEAGTSGGVSPAARYAAMERSKTLEGNKQQNQDMGMMEVMERTFLPGGILSPAPASLPAVPPDFFSPQPDSNSLSYFHDLSPVLHGNRNYIEGSFMPSPSSFVSPTLPSLDLFNNFLDF